LESVKLGINRKVSSETIAQMASWRKDGLNLGVLTRGGAVVVLTVFEVSEVTVLEWGQYCYLKEAGMEMGVHESRSLCNRGWQAL
jgi:D-serine deaminase-like pyridoxal phosphate-dependent protein